MTDKLPTVDIKGKEYVLVKDRVTYFNEKYPSGSISTQLVSNENGQVVVKATVIPDTEKAARYFTGYSQARENDGYINKTSALENAETSAVGRALALMGIGVIESIASADEMRKASASVPAPQPPGAVEVKKQEALSANEKLLEEYGKELDEKMEPENKESDDKWSICSTCGKPATFKEGISSKTGKPYAAYFCSTEDRSHTEWLS